MKLKYIDALRGVAILLVVMVHTLQYAIMDYDDILIPFFSFAAKGVQLFFVASAFTLFLSYDFRQKVSLYNFGIDVHNINWLF